MGITLIRKLIAEWQEVKKRISPWPWHVDVPDEDDDGEAIFTRRWNI